MLSITRKKINADGSVELDMEYEMFGYKSGTDNQVFPSKEIANKYYSSMMASVLRYNIEKYLNAMPDKDNLSYKSFYAEFKWCIDMEVDYKTIIDIVRSNKLCMDIISASNEDCKIMGDKIISFCS